MNADNRWQNDLQELARELAGQPRVQESVMDQVELQSATIKAPQASRRLSFRTVSRLAAFVGTVAAGILIAWFVGFSRPAFAQVQDAIRKIKSAVITREFPDQPEVSARLLVSREHDLYRTEWNDGATIIQSREGRTLGLNTKDKLAHVIPGAGFGLKGERLAPSEFLGRLESVEADAVRSLGTKNFEGRKVEGFELPTERGMRRRVWVDPNSHLPVHEEIAPAVSAQPNDDPRVITLRPPRSTVTYQFNHGLDDSLFSLDPPDGYQLVESNEFSWPGRELTKIPDDLDAASYVIIPGSGIGLARFGMSKQDVVEALGAPDGMNFMGEQSDGERKAYEEIDRKAKQEGWDEFRRHREQKRLDSRKESLVRTSEVLMYSSLGFHVVIRDDAGLQEIMCWPKSSAFREFVGATDQGISMKSSPDDVVQAYGESTKKVESETGLGLFYEQLQIGFSFDADGKMQTIHAMRPKSD